MIDSYSVFVATTSGEFEREFRTYEQAKSFADRAIRFLDCVGARLVSNMGADTETISEFGLEVAI